MSGLSLRLADVLAALSVVTDLGTEQTPEKAVRACLVATKLACRMGASDSEARDVYYASLLRHLGCTASSHVEAFLFGGDELRSRPPGEQADFGNWRDMAALFASTAKGTGWHRPKYLARVLRAGSSTDALILEANCEVAARLVDRLELGAGVHSGVYEVFERWDGSGAPQGLAGAEISLPAQLGEGEFAPSGDLRPDRWPGCRHRDGPAACRFLVRSRSLCVVHRGRRRTAI